jgi:tRNA pseudouridine38-40 synthase
VACRALAALTERSETEAEPRKRIRLLVAYDGTDFHGFAENTGVVTVGGTLRAAIERVLGTGIELTVAGRTDAGVHAWGQVVSFDALGEGLDLERLQRSINGLCRPAIVVRAAEVAPEGFDARFSAAWRRYRYTVLNRAVPDPFLARTAWLVPEPLDLAVLRLACDPLLGEHDFTSFCRAPRVSAGMAPATLVRRVTEAGWREGGDGVLRFEIRANAFCHQMVRSLVGLLVDVGRGRRRAGDVLTVLRARDRSHLGNIAPPTGLCLWEVGYPDGFGRA